ncbi:hypothetical protein PpBr36_03492 [Pyricularia pennisetigena]|uniref:hypothetical protein n=1 Tax=Pyricularia pennisetigena TaxID=1578925 RepID=UPI0011538758|nr:hypothetical protein PpBr36_03492 [Pyricularia pennisetigena]TLS31012.1 hypothetical protein PpBr36_03492 [Pyricularia pennisetigena]
MYPKYLIFTLVAGVVAVPVTLPNGAAKNTGALQARSTVVSAPSAPVVDVPPVAPAPTTVFPSDDDVQLQEKSRGSKNHGSHHGVHKRSDSDNKKKDDSKKDTTKNSDSKSSSSSGSSYVSIAEVLGHPPSRSSSPTKKKQD